MKIVNILGGLGNQMFQYAFALKLQYLLPKEQIKIYTKAFRGYTLHNGYELNKIFKVDIPEASEWEVAKVYWPIINYNIYRLCRYVLPDRKGFKDSYLNPIKLNEIDNYSFFDGYFQRISHFDDIQDLLTESFKFPIITDESNNRALQFLSRGITASIHIRRGDYLKDNNYGGICDLNYYKKAIRFLKQETDVKQVLIFSNDIEWSRNNLREELGGFEKVYVDWNIKSDSYKDMQLMSMCNHNVIANSSFSWWGAFLNQNPNKIVISPDKWAHSYQDAPIIPSRWIKISL